MTWEPYSDTPGEWVVLVCTDIGPPTSMWTVGKSYLTQVSGPLCGAFDLTDDLGRTRTLLNQEHPTFPMGTSGRFPFERVHTARFERLEPDTYLYRPGDPPFTCPKDLWRTEFMSVRDDLQLHTCPHCGSVYWLEEDP